MASSGNSGGSGSWWNSFVQTAMEKSINAYELIKTDLNEFTTTMKHDIGQVSSQLQDSSLLERVTSVATTSKESNIEKPKIKPDKKMKPASSIYDRFKSELIELQNNQETYLNDPNSKEYSEWKESYDPDSNKGIISDLLIENSVMRSLYSQLVPAVISNKDFWTRYFFKAKLIEDEHKTRTNLIQKATSQTSENSYEKLSWDEDGEEDWNKIESSKDNKNVKRDIKESTEKENTQSETNIVDDSLKPNLEDQLKTNPATNLDDKKLEDSDEWEKDFEETSSEKSSNLLNVAETIKEKQACDKQEDTADNEDEHKQSENIEKNDDWESWD